MMLCFEDPAKLKTKKVCYVIPYTDQFYFYRALLVSNVEFNFGMSIVVFFFRMDCVWSVGGA